jgi:hypothetical protein
VHGAPARGRAARYPGNHARSVAERVKARLRKANAKSVHIGRPKVAVDVSMIKALGGQGLPWLAIGKRLGVGEGTFRRVELASFETLASAAAVSD